jgi:anthranilate synthase/aminodeoxychorismate synthase-like glutamine amidotransferase
MILLIDNYDSFVWNLARYFERLGQTTRVVRNDAIDPRGVEAIEPHAVVISPGPCSPAEAGSSVEIVRQLGNRLPILGICLGHQAIGAAFGARIVRAREPVHGRTSRVFHQGRGLFTGLPNPLVACRYHSLVVERESLPSELEVTAWTADNTVMAIAHRSRPVFGLQFHPESILTELGYPLLSAFLRAAAIELPAELPTMAGERAEPRAPASVLPTGPVTF